MAAEPGAAAGADGLLDYGDIDGGVFGELVGARETRGACADDDDVGVGVGDHVGHVPAGHLARHDRLPNRLEPERAEVVGRRWRCRGHGGAWPVGAESGGGMEGGE